MERDLSFHIGNPETENCEIKNPAVRRQDFGIYFQLTKLNFAGIICIFQICSFVLRSCHPQLF